MRENQEARHLTSLGTADSRLDGLIKRTPWMLKRMDGTPKYDDEFPQLIAIITTHRNIKIKKRKK